MRARDCAAGMLDKTVSNYRKFTTRFRITLQFQPSTNLQADAACYVHHSYWGFADFSISACSIADISRRMA
jgi:hypothetical protein